MDCDAEYIQIVGEYSKPVGKFFEAIQLVSSQSGQHQLTLTLLDNNELMNVKVNVQVCESGWFDASSEIAIDFFPTFEALACQISPKFKKAWWEALDAAVKTADSPLLSSMD